MKRDGEREPVHLPMSATIVVTAATSPKAPLCPHLFDFRDGSGASIPDCSQGTTLLEDESEDEVDLVPIKIEIERTNSSCMVSFRWDGDPSPVFIPCVPAPRSALTLVVMQFGGVLHIEIYW